MPKLNARTRFFEDRLLSFRRLFALICVDRAGEKGLVSEPGCVEWFVSHVWQ